MEENAVGVSNIQPLANERSAKRIRIMFIDCPNLDVAAASYLVLSQNSVQDFVQFEVCHHWIYSNENFVGKRRLGFWESLQGWLEWLSSFGDGAKMRRFSRMDRLNPSVPTGKIDRGGWRKEYGRVISGYDEWMAGKGPYCYDSGPAPTIVVTETPISGGFFCDSDDGIGIISTAQWKNLFKPVSALDFVLAIVQRVSLYLIFPGLSSHYVTRGCLWDFAHHQRDARISIMTGHMCQTCRDVLLNQTDSEMLKKIELLVARQWVGDRDIQFSPASVLAHVYKYDLSRSTGVSSTFFRRVWASFEPEFGKIFGEALKWSAVIAITALMASNFPGVLKGIKENLSSEAAGSTSVGRAVKEGRAEMLGHSESAVTSDAPTHLTSEQLRFQAGMLERRLWGCNMDSI